MTRRAAAITCVLIAASALACDRADVRVRDAPTAVTC